MLDREFLHKVMNKIIGETMLDREEKVVFTPFGPHYLFSYFFRGASYYPPQYFIQHCSNIYGLDTDETYYVWDEYVHKIKTMLYNG